jgi:hypothetical protein
MRKCWVFRWPPGASEGPLSPLPASLRREGIDNACRCRKVSGRFTAATLIFSDCTVTTGSTRSFPRAGAQTDLAWNQDAAGARPVPGEDLSAQARPLELPPGDRHGEAGPMRPGANLLRGQIDHDGFIALGSDDSRQAPE